MVESSLDKNKAINTSVLNLKGKTDIADYMIIASGTSHRHIATMAAHLRKNLRSKGFKEIFIEGDSVCDWVLIDAGDIHVHLFRPDVREFYGLEKLWGASEKIDRSIEEQLA